MKARNHAARSASPSSALRCGIGISGNLVGGLPTALEIVGVSMGRCCCDVTLQDIIGRPFRPTLVVGFDKMARRSREAQAGHPPAVPDKLWKPYGPSDAAHDRHAFYLDCKAAIEKILTNCQVSPADQNLEPHSPSV